MKPKQFDVMQTHHVDEGIRHSIKYMCIVKERSLEYVIKHLECRCERYISKASIKKIVRIYNKAKNLTTKTP